MATNLQPPISLHLHQATYSVVEELFMLKPVWSMIVRNSTIWGIIIIHVGVSEFWWDQMRQKPIRLQHRIVSMAHLAHLSRNCSADLVWHPRVQFVVNGGYSKSCQMNPTINQKSGDGLIIIPELSHYYPKDYYSPKNYGSIIVPLSQKSVHILPEIPQSLPQGLTYTRLLRGFRMVRVLLGPRALGSHGIRSEKTEAPLNQRWHLKKKCHPCSCSWENQVKMVELCGIQFWWSKIDYLRFSHPSLIDFYGANRGEWFGWCDSSGNCVSWSVPLSSHLAMESQKNWRQKMGEFGVLCQLKNWNLKFETCGNSMKNMIETYVNISFYGPKSMNRRHLDMERAAVVCHGHQANCHTRMGLEPL